MLTEDEKYDGQKWALVSFVSRRHFKDHIAFDELFEKYKVSDEDKAVFWDSIEKYAKCAIKIRRVLPDCGDEEIQKAAEYIRNSDPSFDVWVQEMYKWCFIPPDPEAMPLDKQHFMDERLNTLLRDHHSLQSLAKQQFNERKNNMMQ